MDESYSQPNIVQTVGGNWNSRGIQACMSIKKSSHHKAGASVEAKMESSEEIRQLLSRVKIKPPPSGAVPGRGERRRNMKRLSLPVLKVKVVEWEVNT